MLAEDIGSADVVSKSEFAQICEVSKARVSQWIKEGKIEGDALVGEGRKAKIAVVEAQAQLNEKLDISQRLGNGAATKLPSEAAAPAEPRIEDLLKQEKLEELQRRNRIAQEQERARAGTYTRTDDARAATAKAVGSVITSFEAGLSDIANEIAAKFEVSQRDALHLLRQEFRRLRKQVADRLAAEANEINAIVADDDVSQ